MVPILSYMQISNKTFPVNATKGGENWKLVFDSTYIQSLSFAKIKNIIAFLPNTNDLEFNLHGMKLNAEF